MIGKFAGWAFVWSAASAASGAATILTQDYLQTKKIEGENHRRKIVVETTLDATEISVGLIVVRARTHLIGALLKSRTLIKLK